MELEAKEVESLNLKQFIEFSSGYFDDDVDFFKEPLAALKAEYLNYYESILKDLSEEELDERLRDEHSSL